MNKFLQQLNAMWGKLEVAQRATIILVALAFAAVAVAIGYGSTRPDLRLLARDLKPGQVAEIASYLEQAHVKYQVSDHETAILVPEKDIYRLRNELAEREMLGDGSKGFELLTKANMWDSTFTEHKTYDRAVCGELERSFREIPGVRSARIIIDRPAPSPFVGDADAQPRASIKLDVKTGGRLSAKQIAGIIHLTAGAVAGLAPERVQVMDGSGLLTTAAPDSGAAMAATTLEAEAAREAYLTRKAQDLLDATVGRGRSQVKVAVKLDFTKRTEASSNPDKSMPLKEHTTATEENTPVFANAGLVGTVSNVETADSGSVTPPANAKKTNEESRNEYVVGQRTITQEDEIGRVKGMSVSILLDYREKKVAKKDDKGQPTKEMETVFEPIDPKEQEKLKQLVLGAIGFYSAKGSQGTQDLPAAVEDRFKAAIECIQMYREESEPITVQASAAPAILGKPLSEWIGYGVAALVALTLIIVARGQLKRSHLAWASAEERARRDGEERAKGIRAAAAEGETKERRQELKDSIKRAVQQDPAAAAAIIRKWMHG